MIKHITYIATAVLCLGVGLWVGWIVGMTSETKAEKILIDQCRHELRDDPRYNAEDIVDQVEFIKAFAAKKLGKTYE